MNRPTVRIILALTGLVAALWLVHGWDDEVSGSFTPDEPALLVVPLARRAALAAGWYLVAVTLVGSLARLVRVRPAVRLADVVTVPALRRLLDASVGVSLITGVGAGPAAAAREHPPPTMVRLPDHPTDRRLSGVHLPPTPAHDPVAAPTTSSAPPTTSVPTTTTVVATTTTTSPTADTTSLPTATTTPPISPPAAPTTAPVVVPAPVSQHDSEPGPSGLGPSPPDAGQWTVERGDHFWSIAEQVLARSLQRAPTDAETVPYWRALVELNRHRLADRHNPDLLFAGQVLALPPVPVPAPP